MTKTQEIANRYYELAIQNEWLQIQEELHDDAVICREPEHVADKGFVILTEGKAALRSKTLSRRAQIETLHDQFCSEPLVGGHFFSVTLKRDVTFKNQQRMQLAEIGVYEVKDGKIISEQFFY